MRLMQILFNKVVRGIITQGAGAYDVNKGACRYRTEDGRKCAVGVLVPDSKYNPEMEGATVENLLDGRLFSPEGRESELTSMQALYGGKKGHRLALYEAINDFHNYPDSLDRREYQLLSDLQTIHDRLARRHGPNHADFIKEWKEQTKALALVKGLNDEVCK